MEIEGSARVLIPDETFRKYRYLKEKNGFELREEQLKENMEIMDTGGALEAVERLQAKLKARGEAPTQEKLSLLKTLLQSPLFHHILTTQQPKRAPRAKGKRISKSVSMNSGACVGLKALSHSDSYTWAVENRRSSTTKYFHRDGSHSSLDSLDLHCTDFYPEDSMPAESQFCTPPRISRTMSMGRNLAAIAHERRHVEIIELNNDGKGLGFGIVGGRSTGVMVKTILPGGAAGQDKRLRSGDQILRIGDTDLLGMNSEQVAQVLRNAGSQVKLLVARDDAKDNHLLSSPVLSPRGAGNALSDSEEDYEFSVQFTKNSLGLGFTITSYIGDLNAVYSAGVTVKSVVKGSTVDQDGRLRIGDIILEVDGVSLQGCSEQRAMEVLRRTGPLVRLRMLRKAVRLSHILPPAPRLQPLRHSHSFNAGNPYRVGLSRVQEPAGIRTLSEISRRAAYASRRSRHDWRNGVKLTPAEEQDLQRRWERAVGPRFEVVVCQLQRFSASSGLGLSLEARAGHHYLCSVLPEGPVGQSGSIFPGDQILEVNGIPLIGETHKEVVNILKELPLHICLVGSRVRPPTFLESEEDEEDESQLTLKELLAEFNDKLDHGCVLPCPTAEDITKRGVPPVSPPLAMWEKQTYMVELEKGESGLGFSILDYQDPEDATKTVLVIRSLVPGGVADLDGNLLPGDRLVAVNDSDLQGASLDYAVHVLKSTSYGPVRIGVAKPLPLELCGGLTPISERSARTSYDDADGLSQLSLLVELTDNANANASAGRPEENHSSSGGGGGQLVYCRTEKFPAQHSAAMEDGDKQRAPPPANHTRHQRTITVVRGNHSLGVSVGALKDGSGVLVRSVLRDGCVGRDGRLEPGDVILAVNGEPTSNLTSAKARALLRRHSVIGPEIRVTYVPASQVEEHRASLHLPPLASLAAPSPTPTPSPEPPQPAPAATRPPAAAGPLGHTLTQPPPATAGPPGHLQTQPPPATTRPPTTTGPVGPLQTTASPVLSPASQVQGPVPGVDLLAAGAGALLRAKVNSPFIILVPTITPASDTSWQTPRSPLLRARGGDRRDGGRGEEEAEEEERRKRRNVPTVWVSAAAGGTNDGEEEEEEEDEELNTLRVQSWGQPRSVALRRAGGRSLGISITGGRGMGSRVPGGEVVRGVFIKHISPGSPAALNGTLRAGDRLLEVCGVDLRDVSHEEAVEAIRRAGDSVVFLVQTGQDRAQSPLLGNHERLTPTPQSSSQSTKDTENVSNIFLSLSPANPFTPTPFKVPPPTANRTDPTGPARVVSPTANRRAQMMGPVHVVSPAANVMDQTSPASMVLPAANRMGQTCPALVVSPAAVQAEPGGVRALVEGAAEGGDDTSRRMLQRYGSLAGRLLMVELEKAPRGPGLGLSLAGNRDGSRARMSVYVAAVDPRGAAGADGRIRPGDELLEINGQVLYGRSHQNASTLIKNAPAKVNIILIRNTAALSQMDCGAKAQDQVDVHAQAHIPEPGDPYKDILHLILPQDHVSLGVSLEQDPARGAVVVSALSPHGAAAKDGRIKVGDAILSVGDQAVEGFSADMVSGMIKRQRVSVKLSLGRARPPSSASIASTASTTSTTSTSLTLPTASPSPRSLSPLSAPFSSTSSSSSPASLPLPSPSPFSLHAGRPPSSDPPGPPADPQGCPVAAGRESTIEICKGSTGLGLSIVGGCDTLLGTVIIHEVNHGGAAQRDGRLLAGDQILEVNGIDLRQATHEEALGVLRLSTQRVRLCVFRHQESYREEDLWDVFPLELRPPPGRGLGFCTVGKNNDTGIFVSEILQQGVADKDGRLLLGDQILSINGEDVRAASQKHAEKLLQTSGGAVYLEVARFKAGLQYPQGSQEYFKLCFIQNEDSDCSTLTPSSACETVVGRQRETESKAEGCAVRKVVLEKGACESLGVCVAGGRGSPHGDVPLFITAIDRSGPAAKTHQLQAGDRLISINGASTEGMTHVEAGAMLKNASGAVTLHVAADSEPQDQGDGDPLCLLSCPNNLCARAYQTIALERGSSGLGFSVVGGFGSPHGDLPIYVKTVFSKGAALEDGRLRRGDQIIAVNGHCLEGSTHAEAVEVIKRTRGTVVLTVLS